MKNQKKVNNCLACGSDKSDFFKRRGDGQFFLKCSGCGSIYLEYIPCNVEELYSDNYFGLSESDAANNDETKIGYEDSYLNIYSNAEFYWAFRLVDYVLKKNQRIAKKCLDIGAATGRLLNVFRGAGYITHGIEFSSPARAIAIESGHFVVGDAVESYKINDEKFNVVTALEVIEHVEVLPQFFKSICSLLAEDGLFFGYFPSADEHWFSVDDNYHWLHHSYEHLIYPTDLGIRKAMLDAFSEDVFTTTFLTKQGLDVIPNTLVLAFKNRLPPTIKAHVGEIFRELNYINDKNFLGTNSESGLLPSAWFSTVTDAASNGFLDLAFVVGLLCSKFGVESVTDSIYESNDHITELTKQQRTDLLAMSMHRGKLDYMRNMIEIFDKNAQGFDLRDEFINVLTVNNS